MLIVTATFRLVPGTDLEEFLAADERFEREFADNLPGASGRMVGRNEDGQWIVIQCFESSESFAGAAHATTGLDAVEALHRFIDFDTHVVSVYETP